MGVLADDIGCVPVLLARARREEQGEIPNV